jgi:hypothetical protein
MADLIPPPADTRPTRLAALAMVFARAALYTQIAVTTACVAAAACWRRNPFGWDYQTSRLAPLTCFVLFVILLTCSGIESDARTRIWNRGALVLLVVSLLMCMITWVAADVTVFR